MLEQSTLMLLVVLDMKGIGWKGVNPALMFIVILVEGLLGSEISHVPASSETTCASHPLVSPPYWNIELFKIHFCTSSAICEEELNPSSAISAYEASFTLQLFVFMQDSI